MGWRGRGCWLDEYLINAGGRAVVGRSCEYTLSLMADLKSPIAVAR